jgi:hypothetical protein
MKISINTTMRKRFAKIWFLLVCILALGVIINVQVYAQEKNTLTQERQLKIINEIRDKLEKVYPFSDIGMKTSKGLYQNFQDNKYLDYQAPDDFAQQLSKDLEDISNDEHFAIFYDPETAFQMKEELKKGPKSSFEDLKVEEYRWINFGFKELKILDGKVGYLDLRTFFPVKYAGETAVASMNYFANCKALIIDLRNNGGGWDDMVMFLLSYFFDNDSPEPINIAHSTLDSTYNASILSSYVPGKKLTEIPLYILTSHLTASAAEGFANIMKHLNNKATLVGEKTVGAENPVGHVVIGDEFILKIPCWRKIYSATDSGWEGVGVKPDIAVSSDSAFFVAHLEALKKLSQEDTSEKSKKRYQWAIDGVMARNNPVNIKKSILQSYAGKYGNKVILYESGDLYYQYKDIISKSKMLPITENYFFINNHDDFRILFKKEKGNVVGFDVIFDDGYTIKNDKNLP